MADRVGQQLGNYTITKLLGQGGFAEVYLGEHRYLKSQAAIKILQTRLSGADDTESFLKEAQTIAHLSHPNIVRVMDFGIEDETPFLVMDYAPNGTLRQFHTRGTTVPLPSVVTYVKQVADALQYAHDERLIHRDIKPENMLIGRRNEILLSDFGIALVAQSSRYQGTQDVIGTVAYMSPEQIQGKPRPASDQYSLGIVVYEWLTGDRPFHGSFTEMCTQHMFAAPPPIREKLAVISPEIELVVVKALEKDPKQRFASIQEFAQALEQASLPAQSKTAATETFRTSYATVAMTQDAEANGTMLAQTPSQIVSGQFQPPQSLTGNGKQGLTARFDPSSQMNPSTNQPAPPLPTMHSSETMAQTGNEAQSQGPFMPTQLQTSYQNSQGGNMGNNRPGGSAQNNQTNQNFRSQPSFTQAANGGPFPTPQASQPNPYSQQPNPYGQHQGPPPPPPPNPAAMPGYPQQQQQRYPAQNPAPNNGQQQIPPAFQRPQQYEMNQQSQAQQQHEMNQQAPQRQQQPEPERPSMANNSSRESSDDFLDIIGPWKWHVVATIAGLLIIWLLGNFNPIYQHFSLNGLLIISIFFGASFGPVVGIIIGIAGFLIHGSSNMGNSSSSYTTYALWFPWLISAASGVIPGLAVIFRKKIYPSIGSAIRSCILAALGLGIMYGIYFYQAGGLSSFPIFGMDILADIVVAGIFILIYAIAGRMVDPG
jgi:serine/threonine protein kinase